MTCSTISAGICPRSTNTPPESVIALRIFSAHRFSHKKSAAEVFLGSLLAARSRSSSTEETGDRFAQWDEHLVRLFVEIVQLEQPQAAVLIFLDKDDIHEANDASLCQIQELGNDRARELIALECDEGVLQWVTLHGMPP